MFNLSRRTKTILIFLILIAVGYALARFWQGRDDVPKDFTDARLQGAAIAFNIVTLSNQSTNDLEKVNQYDKDGDYTDALTITTNLVVQSQQIRDQAVALSTQIENMTKSLSSINSDDARQAALEAITSRLALVTQLVNYSGDLETLLDTLRDRFSGKPTPAGAVQALVNQINTDVAAVNNFNTQATQAMTQFDVIMAKS
jgi:hypothetical protein